MMKKIILISFILLGSFYLQAQNNETTTGITQKDATDFLEKYVPQFAVEQKIVIPQLKMNIPSVPQINV